MPGSTVEMLRARPCTEHGNEVCGTPTLECSQTATPIEQDACQPSLDGPLAMLSYTFPRGADIRRNGQHIRGPAPLAENRGDHVSTTTPGERILDCDAQCVFLAHARLFVP